MSEPFLGEIRLVGFNFAPRGWSFCDGQILPINQNQSLFSLLGTTYGGDGRTSFALPDMRGRVNVHFGEGASLGQKSGAETDTLTIATMPSHNHTMHAENKNADQIRPTGRLLAVTATDTYVDPDTANNVTMNDGSVGHNGGGQSHDNMQPWIGINHCIALVGLFPSRN